MEEFVNVCPICGETPTLKIVEEIHFIKSTFTATIRCKPFLQKPHLKIEYESNNREDAVDHAIRRWNEVTCIMRVK